MSTWYLISVFLHIVFAAFWIGGMLFLPLAILPGIKQHPDRIAILYQTGLKFRFYGWIALGGLLATGWLNMYTRDLPLSALFFVQSDYGRLVTVKLILFTLVLLTSAAHDWMFGGKALEELQNTGSRKYKLLARWSGRINLLLALAMAFIGVVLSRGGVFPG